MHPQLECVHRHIPVGLTTPPLSRFRGVRRVLALALARCVRYLARVVTGEQRSFNQATFDMLRDLHARLEELEQKRRLLEGRHEAALERHSAVLDECEAALEEQHTLLGQLKDDQEQARQRQELFNDHLRPLPQRLEQLRLDLLREQDRVDRLLEAARKGAAEPVPQRLTAAAGPSRRPAGLDRLCAAFEARFRGGPEDVKERLRVYLPLLQDAALGTEAAPVLDLGCGRGEWLDLLREHGLCARGVDCNEVFVAECRRRGLAVSAADGVEHLRTLPDASLGAVTAFHLAEHLPFPALLELLGETVRVLAPGGLALFETPNPENLLVGSCSFHADPTHQHPLVASTFQFLAEHRGLVRVEVRPVDRPVPALPFGTDRDQRPGLSPWLELVRERVRAAADYALVGWKA
jgi:SAM-dependent methyltransferase